MGAHPRDVRVLLLLFGALYFAQGLIEPTACLPAQPLQSALTREGLGPEAVGRFFGVIGIAWSLKPLFGLLSDFVPLLGMHRLSWLLLSTAGTTLGFGLLAATGGPVADGALVLAAVGFAIATGDVVVDALAVEQGQPLGITGTIQSVQWGASAAASVLAGVGGGWLAGGGRTALTYGVCALAGLASCALVLTVVREPRRRRPAGLELRLAFRALRRGSTLAVLGSVAAFLFLWNFNPFSTNVLQEYTTNVLGLTEQAYGNLVSLQAVAQIAASVAYAAYCRRVPFGRLLHLSVAMGIVSSLAYWGMVGPASAVAANLVFGFAYQTSMLVTLDLAARTCPTAAAGTGFAVMMAVSNTGTTLATTVGGTWYETLTARLGGPDPAFDALVAIGAASTAACWLLVPVLRRAGVALD